MIRRWLSGLILASTVAVGATTCSVPAQADPDIPAEAAEAGKLDAGWIRVTCSGTTVNQQCHLRFPDGFRRLDLTYIIGGDKVAETSTFTDQPGRPRLEQQRTDSRIVSGVRVSCSTVGAWVACTVRIRERVRDYEDTYWSAGSNQGGIVWQSSP